MAYRARSNEAGGPNALLLYLCLGPVRWVVGATIADLVFRWPVTPGTQPTRPQRGADARPRAATLGGVVVGWFIDALVVSRAPISSAPSLRDGERRQRPLVLRVFASVRVIVRRLTSSARTAVSIDR